VSDLIFILSDVLPGERNHINVQWSKKLSSIQKTLKRVSSRSSTTNGQSQVVIEMEEMKKNEKK